MVKTAQKWFSIEDVSFNQSSEWCDSLLPLVSPDATWHLRNRWRHVASALASLAVKLLVLMSRAQKSGYNVFSILNLILNAIGILDNSTWVYRYTLISGMMYNDPKRLANGMVYYWLCRICFSDPLSSHHSITISPRLGLIPFQFQKSTPIILNTPETHGFHRGFAVVFWIIFLRCHRSFGKIPTIGQAGPGRESGWAKSLVHTFKSTWSVSQMFPWFWRRLLKNPSLN